MQWTTGSRSGGSRGFGGNEALAGINAGDGSRFVTVPQSLTPEIIYVDRTSNVGTPGVWMYQVNTGTYYMHTILVYIAIKCMDSGCVNIVCTIM